jgi:predicted ATP-binding protein involved in virulence
VHVTKLGLENFLSFDEGELELGDLTILVRPNGARSNRVILNP